MKLRTLIFIALLIVGLAPMLAVVVLSVPDALKRMERFHQQTQLQSLRADFAELDQYLASRKEMVRVLAKLTPSGLLAKPSGGAKEFGESEQDQLVYWVNQFLRGGLDIYRVVYLDASGQERFRLEREKLGAPLMPAKPVQDPDERTYFEAGVGLGAEGVYVGPIRLADAAGPAGPLHFLTLTMATPVLDDGDSAEGVVIMHVDMGGLPIAHPDTVWVHNDGRYLFMLGQIGYPHSAFSDYPGLDEIFGQGDLALWRGPKGEQMIWVPMFATEKSGPIWVGRRADPTDVTSFLQTLRNRVFVLVLLVVLSVLLVVRFLSLRVDRFGRDLTEGIGRVLRTEPGVVFGWSGPRELRELGENLTRLAVRHERATEALLARARELEESNRYKSEFLANVSHELRTPLNSILLLSKILADNDGRNLSEEQVQQARVVHQAGSRLLEMIDTILGISKIEANKTSFVIERIRVEEIWSPLLELIRPQALVKGLVLEQVHEEDAPAEAVTDAEKVRQILTNFLANAVKFTGAGAITVATRRNQEADSAERPLCLCVDDTGIGIPKEKHELIFEAFRQADGSTSRRFGGTGLGLTISSRLAELIGGRITVKSDEGQGASFCLLLPLELDASRIDRSRVVSREADSAATAESDRASDSAGPNVDAWPGRQADAPRVLLVDNDVRHLLELTPLLEARGWQVVAAGDYSEAREVLESEPRFRFALVRWPGEAGGAAEILAALRGTSATGEEPLPVVALLDPEQAEQCPECRRDGAADCLVRPVEPSVLGSLLGRLTAGARDRRGVEPSTAVGALADSADSERGCQ